MQERPGLTLGIVFTAIWVVYLFFQSWQESQLNARFTSTDSIPVPAIVDQVIQNPRSKTGQEVDTLRVHFAYLHDSHSTRTDAGELISRTLAAGSSVPVRFLADAPSLVRVDLPSESDRYRRHAKSIFIAGIIATCVCIFCSLGLWRSFRKQ